MRPLYLRFAQLCDEFEVAPGLLAISDRRPEVVTIRCHIIRQLKAEGYHPASIADLLCRDRTTVLYHLGHCARKCRCN